MNPPVETRISRVAGLVYLVVVVTGLFSLAYVPSRLAGPGGSQAAFQRIVSSEPLFRYGIASFLVNQVAFLVLPLVLFRLLRPVNRDVAVLMVPLAVVSVPISLASVVNELDVLSLLADSGYHSTIPPASLAAMAGQSLEAYHNGLLVSSLFWGLWLLPFGYLVLKSGFLPKILGIILMLGCLGYTIHVFGQLLVPRYSETLIADLALKPAAVGEIGSSLWLLLVGGRKRS